ncbi:hypothetical protein HPB48_000411 [Haemaphysalis longicornis]|uniref:Uncharacterized protein n=1 Tax=Haemaphysalis longicornis TaxID=44386 RepID=A0A9J6FRP3_HAELO|nr:hypothetical protein HPB48_000411 [Haemaphysalis longicornis]
MNEAHSGQLEELFANLVGRLDHHNCAIDEKMSSITEKMTAWLADANSRIAVMSNPFRIQFESVAVASDWSLTDQAHVLVSQLRPPASDELKYLLGYTRLGYPRLITAMEDPVGDARFQQLHFAELKRVRQQGMTLEDLAHRVERLTHEALAGSPNATEVVIGTAAFVEALENPNV